MTTTAGATLPRDVEGQAIGADGNAGVDGAPEEVTSQTGEAGTEASDGQPVAGEQTSAGDGGRNGEAKPADGAEAPVPEEVAATAPGGEGNAAEASKELRISVRLKPRGEEFLAVLSVSTPSTDVFARTATVASVDAGLAEVGTVIAQAQEHWAQSPRNPKHRASTVAKPAATKTPTRPKVPEVAPTLQRLTAPAPMEPDEPKAGVTSDGEDADTAQAAPPTGTAASATEAGSATAEAAGRPNITPAANEAAVRKADSLQPALF